MSPDKRLDRRLCKAARELVQWTQDDLAAASGVSVVSIKRYESRLKPVSDDVIERLREALEVAGVEFVAAGRGKGEGVRLRDPLGSE